MEDIILVKNIEKNFKGKKLFCDFSFSVEKKYCPCPCWTKWVREDEPT